MNENTLQLIQICKILWIAGIAGCYGYAGISGKWKRRFLGSGLLTVGFVLFSLLAGKFSWWILLCFPLYIGAFSLGYGGNKLLTKLIKRTYCGAAIAFASLPLAIALHTMPMWYGQLVLMTGMMVWLGAFNPTASARNEETLLGVFAGLLPLFMI